MHLQKGALSTAEVCEALGMSQLKGRKWHVQRAVAIRGEGLYEGLDWWVHHFIHSPYLMNFKICLNLFRCDSLLRKPHHMLLLYIKIRLKHPPL